MGFLDFLYLHKEEQPKEAIIKTAQPIQMLYDINKRGSIRYLLKPISQGKVGVLVNISRTGCRIKKAIVEQIDYVNIRIHLGIMTLNAQIVWQDEDFLGIEFISGFGDAGFISRHMMRIKEGNFHPLKSICIETIMGFMSKDPFSLMLNLMAEIESPHSNINRLKSLIIKLPNLAPEIVTKAGITKTEDELELRDVDQAVKRLGMDAVKKDVLGYIMANREALESAHPKNSLYESMKVVKKVFFDILAPFFGYKCNTGLVDNLASVEYEGIDLILEKNEDNPQVKEFYASPKKIYSEMTRFCERLDFGRDLLNINRINLKSRKTLSELFDGYILAHMMLNPMYTTDSYVEVNVNKVNLSFAYITFLTFISVQAIIEKDPASIAVFIDRLHITGMDSSHISSFVSNYISEVNRTMVDLGRSSNLKPPPSGKGFKFADYIALKDIPQYSRFIKPFKELEAIKRLVIAYEDEAYAHFILGKILFAEDMGLNTKAYCVIPCENLSTNEIQFDAFSYFSIVILKNVDQLKKFHLKTPS
ncbi:MAG: hypothetical protein H7843_14730 [Nitrospirota bacterium]